jgi:hypothetical protein
VVKATFLVPRRDNAGKPFPAARWRELEQRLIPFGGFTWSDAAGGAWREAGRTYRGQNRAYVVDLPSWTRLADWLGVVAWAREAFDQEAMYVEVAGVPEVLG